MGSLSRRFKPVWKSLFFRPAGPAHRRRLRQSREREMFLLLHGERAAVVPAAVFAAAGPAPRRRAS